MVTVQFVADKLVLSVVGMHKLWALKSELEIPISHVRFARINNNELSRPRGWKVAGARIPGLISAGTYRAHGDRVFWDVVNKEKSIIIDLENDHYRQLVIEVDSPEAVVAMINGRLTAAG